MAARSLCDTEPPRVFLTGCHSGAESRSFDADGLPEAAGRPCDLSSLQCLELQRLQALRILAAAKQLRCLPALPALAALRLDFDKQTPLGINAAGLDYTKLTRCQCAGLLHPIPQHAKAIAPHMPPNTDSKHDRQEQVCKRDCRRRLPTQQCGAPQTAMPICIYPPRFNSPGYKATTELLPRYPSGPSGP